MRGQFNVATHKLKKRKRRYYYKCTIGECSVSFSKMSAWNVHHLAKHRDVKFRCNECGKVLRTPSSYKNHLNLHKECHFCYRNRVRLKCNGILNNKLSLKYYKSSPLLAPRLQHVGKHTPLSLLTP